MRGERAREGHTRAGCRGGCVGVSGNRSRQHQGYRKASEFRQRAFELAGTGALQTNLCTINASKDKRVGGQCLLVPHLLQSSEHGCNATQRELRHTWCCMMILWTCDQSCKSTAHH